MPEETLNVHAAMAAALPLLDLRFPWRLLPRTQPGATVEVIPDGASSPQQIEVKHDTLEGFCSLLTQMVEQFGLEDDESEDARISVDLGAKAPRRGNTELTYQYRDAANYKVAEAVVLAGRPSRALVNLLLLALDEEDGISFVPGQVGLPDLQGSYSGGAAWDDDVDHPFHEVLGIHATSAQAQPHAPTFQELARKMLRVRFAGGGWDASYRPGCAHDDNDHDGECTARRPGHG